MARFFNGTVLTALVAGFAGGVMASLVLPNASRSIRPAAKSAIKAGLALYETGRERVAELGEATSDLIAEVQAEREEELAKVQAAGSGQGEERAEAFATTPSDEDVLAARSRKYDA
jgi:Protein of unknown function (DUF5132)